MSTEEKLYKVYLEKREDFRVVCDRLREMGVEDIRSRPEYRNVDRAVAETYTKWLESQKGRVMNEDKVEG